MTPSAFDPQLVEAAQTSSAWPFEEARKLVARREAALKAGKDKGYVLFETGYGPSGLPHIGTFGEVARTTMVRNAFRLLTNDTVPTRLVAFSDDMDGLRKVPDNVPNGELLARHLNQPLTRVPDPFGTHESFGAHNNARLRAFLDSFGFEYEFMSATECYRSGRFNDTLRLVLERYDEVMRVMLPSLREERAATYSPFLPIHPESGCVMQVPIEEVRVDSATLVWRDPETGKRYETSALDGAAKLQWKPDWAMRWTALGVDYEMAGKDLIDSVKLSGQIARVLGAQPPEGFNYELFLDEKGQKISKSKGNGLTIEEWLTYGAPESLALFMYLRPREAKRLHFDVIPRHMDEYLSFLEAYPRQDAKQRLGNPVHHIHGGNPPPPETVTQAGAASGEGAPRPSQISFSLLLNLAAVANAETREALWAFLRRYAPDVAPETHPRLDQFIGYAVRNFQDFVKPAKHYRPPSVSERAALEDLAARLAALPDNADAATIQDLVYEVGRQVSEYQDFKARGATPERPGVSGAWFNALYQILLGEERGPRFGSFAAILGVPATIELIRKGLDGRLIAEHEAFLAERAARRTA
ncbi:lysine--tRNA ligase [Camelimonas abortus]|uniref:Lysine--tRNA ligase n=1 Tax=Camelimonas abortus TaxID=1017184 RepID=A0ABV7LE04_9HYPH